MLIFVLNMGWAALQTLNVHLAFPRYWNDAVFGGHDLADYVDSILFLSRAFKDPQQQGHCGK
jgi:hypothetical protein